MNVYECIKNFVYVITLSVCVLSKNMQAFIPVRNGQHMFVICMNLKYPNVTLIDSNKVKKTGGIVQKLTPLTAISDMAVASIMVCKFYDQ